MVDNDTAVAFEHFVLVQQDVDVKTFQAVRQRTLALDALLELQNESRFELAVRESERRRGRPPAPAR